MTEEQVNAWAQAAVAAMLARVKKVCVMEYGWLIEELQK